MCFLRRNARLHALPRLQVSILVLLDVLPPVDFFEHIPAGTLGFNPCSSGCASSGSINGDEWGHRVDVSILVLLDVLPPVPGLDEEVSFVYRFQSLFFWMCFLRITRATSTDTHMMFQSLFFWMCFLRATAYSDAMFTIVFQSLFFWMCFLRTTAPPRTPTDNWFQSLFFWMCFLRLILLGRRCLTLIVSILVLLDVLPPVGGTEGTVGDSWCFNPCSSGCASSGLPKSTRGSPRFMFQSLFFWMCFLRHHADCVVSAWSMFQSLFFWMCFLRAKVFHGTSRVTLSFNPCSSGCASSGKQEEPPWLISIQVSILVLLDVLPPVRSKTKCFRDI